MKKKIQMLTAACGLLILCASVAGAQTLVKLENPRLDDIQAAGFEITKPGRIDIESVGLKLKYRDDFNAYSWIINHDTRELVWVMKESHSDRVSHSDYLYKERDNLDLDAGKYELYLYAGSYRFSNISIKGTGDVFNILKGLFGSRDDSDLEDHLDECYVTISSDQLKSGDVKKFDVDGDFAGALIKFNKLRDSEYVKYGFTLDKPMNLHIYSVFEYPNDYKSPVDYGWIVNADTRKKVWEIDRWNSDWAGGSRKNRKYDKEVEFDKGNYILYFVTDDSHSYEAFNANPPYDPINWGIIVMPGDGFDKKAFHAFEPPGRGEPLIDLTRARDDDFLEQPFRLSRKATLHVYCIGEYSFGDREFVDYGWIQDAATGKIVWNMSYSNTEHAGGAKKNRMFDGQVILPKGEYTAYYMTDDSHSYNDWNDSPPFDPSSWGLAIYGSKDLDKGDFSLISRSDITKGSNILVKMVRVRDREKRRDKFVLDKQTRLHIYAIGEGDPDEMYDYGWITDDRSNRSVWEMTWRNTEPAGGARKNRMFDDDIILDPGTYEVHYVSDGSHSFGDWNAARPNDPINWGITVSIVDNK